MRKALKLIAIGMLLAVGSNQAFALDLSDEKSLEPLVIAREGSLYAGGTVKTEPNGDTFHGDHLYAYYQVPVKARKLPLVMWHGCLSPAWETTPDGREGYQQIFVRRGWSVYVIDQPRNGRAGRGLDGFTVAAAAGGDAFGWNTFRLGKWIPPSPRTFFPGGQFPQDPASLDHYLRYGASTGGPSFGPTPSDAAPFTSVAASALFHRIWAAALGRDWAAG